MTNGKILEYLLISGWKSWSHWMPWISSLVSRLSFRPPPPSPVCERVRGVLAQIQNQYRRFLPKNYLTTVKI